MKHFDPAAGVHATGVGRRYGHGRLQSRSALLDLGELDGNQQMVDYAYALLKTHELRSLFGVASEEEIDPDACRPASERRTV